MIRFIVQGESRLVTAEQFSTMVDVAVRMMRDASKDTGVAFTVGELHASEPTIVWAPQPVDATIDIDREFEHIAKRIEDGVDQLEQDGDLPEWMSETTARHLYEASKVFGDSSIDGLVLGRHDHRRRITRQTFRTLDRILHEQTEAIGSIEGVLVTATLTKGAHVSVREGVFVRTVRCDVQPSALPRAGGMIGEEVLVTGRLRRDHQGRPVRMSSAKVEPLGTRRRVSVARMAGTFRGPDSVDWLREQRG
ncbi:hypothetical protein [Euzebya sp.]|uniref:hypothetical protein n=1 Tax=Euzebya sp. TaxID=1971409 RepID=UPI0035130055